MQTKQFNHFIGIDISKKWFDAAVVKAQNSDERFSERFDYSLKGYTSFYQWMGSLGVGIDNNTLICMEHTGVYSKPLIDQLITKHACLWVEMALRIKRSTGLQRGGSDKVSAINIALYAYRFADKARLWKPADKALEQLADLNAQRDRLINAKTMLEAPVNELVDIGLAKAAKPLQKNQSPVIRQINTAIQKIDTQIIELIKTDTSLYRKVQVATSIKGIGMVTAANLVVLTKGFSYFDNYKQLASYCGVAPFSRQSGTSIQTKNRVSPLANKKLKTLLHMCAVSAIQANKDLKAYYQTLIAKGKNKMLAINNVRNKLIKLLCSLIKNDRLYVEEYVYNY